MRESKEFCSGLQFLSASRIAGCSSAGPRLAVPHMTGVRFTGVLCAVPGPAPSLEEREDSRFEERIENVLDRTLLEPDADLVDERDEPEQGSRNERIQGSCLLYTSPSPRDRS